jgi:hypothetical protein
MQKRRAVALMIADDDHRTVRILLRPGDAGARRVELLGHGIDGRRVSA